MTMAIPGDFTARTEQVQARLTDRNVAGLVLFPSPNLSYLTGFVEEPMERHLLLVVTPAAIRMVAPTMYVEQLNAETDLEHIIAWADADDPLDAVQAALTETELANTDGRVLLDETMFARFVVDLQGLLPDASYGLAGEGLEDLRIIKDDAELTALREAASITDAAWMDVRDRGDELIGKTEQEVVYVLRDAIDAHGGDGFSFEPIVGSGPNGAKPHHRSGDRVIEAGDPVVFDFGTVVDGYPGDQTRTVVIGGEPPADFEEVHAIVHEAFQAGIEAVEPGVTAGSVDVAARSVIKDAGYGDAFLHRTGHGVGLEVHEPPYIVGGNNRILEPGMVHSVEPGIYLEGRFGVRIEDLVVVTEDGCEQLNATSRDWRSR